MLNGKQKMYDALHELSLSAELSREDKPQDYEEFVEHVCRHASAEIKAERFHWSFQLPSEYSLKKWYLEFLRKSSPGKIIEK